MLKLRKIATKLKSGDTVDLISEHFHRLRNSATIKGPKLSVARVADSPVAPTEQLKARLDCVEVYQPLYGISGLDAPLRDCQDRARIIADALRPLGREFRLIDFGSSLGYFPFFFADRGAITSGFDVNRKNTEVALATQRLNRLPATFKTAALDLTTVRRIPSGKYQVALILSVLHHIIHRYGLRYVTELMVELLDRIPTLVLELAQRNEEVTFPWRESLPEDPLSILSLCGQINVQLLGESRSHLSTASRPLYLVSREPSLMGIDGGEPVKPAM